MAKEIFIGFSMAFVVNGVFEAARIAGTLADTMSGMEKMMSGGMPGMGLPMQLPQVAPGYTPPMGQAAMAKARLMGYAPPSAAGAKGEDRDAIKAHLASVAGRGTTRRATCWSAAWPASTRRRTGWSDSRPCSTGRPPCSPWWTR
ncbi:hypothetical protein MFUL124B02_15565 [Myxococcus fulvus 124B02]|nr:hypothetical protein MFUL124B02_15565 [Myxococcus fulvus 124B02]